ADHAPGGGEAAREPRRGGPRRRGAARPRDPLRVDARAPGGGGRLDGGRRRRLGLAPRRAPPSPHPASVENRGMERRRLGGGGIEVTRIILGCGNFGGIGSAPPLLGQGESREEAAPILD